MTSVWLCADGTGGSLLASRPQLVKKPSTLGKRSRKLQLSSQLGHVWSADLFLSGGQEWRRLLLSKGQRGDSWQIPLSLGCHCAHHTDVEVRLTGGWGSVGGFFWGVYFVLEKDALACAKCWSCYSLFLCWLDERGGGGKRSGTCSPE